ncbi:MAG: DNA-binding transcriptional regulator, XRE-family domain [Tardiphaga sp.]|nr:DNA-binding transcriptional regulator, XRE-family domain [Tardiphaga sp.]
MPAVALRSLSPGGLAFGYLGREETSPQRDAQSRFVDQRSTSERVEGYVCLANRKGWSVSVAKKRKKQPKPFSARFPVRTSTALEMLGENVRDRRKALGLSQATLAASVAVDQTEISKIENARGNPSVLFAERLAEALKVSLTDLFASRSEAKSA